MTAALRRFAAAVGFLTRVPLPTGLRLEAADVGRGSLFFPLVGAGVGAVQAGAWLALAGRLPGWIVAALVLACGILATGALHQDGLADTADGFGGGRTRDDVLRIMRDHAIGSYGAVALLLVTLIKVGAIAALPGGLRGASLHSPAVLWLVAAPALSRWSAVALAGLLPYARREGGLGGALTEHVGALELVGATAWAAGAAVLVGWRGAAAAAAVVVVTLGSALVCRRKIGGVTGDTLGATIELAEVAVLLVAVWAL